MSNAITVDQIIKSGLQFFFAVMTKIKTGWQCFLTPRQL